MCSPLDRMLRAPDRLHTATQNIDGSVNLDLQEHGKTIFAHVNREVIGILMELHDALKEYVKC